MNEKIDPLLGARRNPSENAAPRLVADNRGLHVHNLGKRFKKRPVVRDVGLYIQRGEVVGLLGPNGAGKTTCFYMITGLVPPDTGTVTIVTETTPFYRQWWFWSGAAVVIGGGIAAAILLSEDEEAAPVDILISLP